jgi:cobaltochelatase CobT
LQRIEAQRQIGIAGLGVGLDLSPYYSRSHVLDLGETSANRLLREIAQLMLGPSRR